MSKIIPLIIGFPIEGNLLKEVMLLNSSCEKEKGIDFNEVLPHITLWMGFVREEDLNLVYNDFHQVFRSVSLDLEVEELQIFEGVSGSVLSLSLIYDRALSTLQNRIHHFWEPYRVWRNDFDNYNNGTITYTNNFKSHSLANYDPHITVGFTSRLKQLSATKFKVQNPEIFLMGNNCTCIEVIKVSPQ